MSDKSETSWDSDCSEPVSASGGGLWDVQEILAERTTVLGGKELLVVWKTSWIPQCNMIPDGPAKRRWNKTTKWASCDTCWNTDMQVILPVEPGSVMASDLARTAALRTRYNKIVEAAAARGAISDGRSIKRGKPSTES